MLDVTNRENSEGPAPERKLLPSGTLRLETIVIGKERWSASRRPSVRKLQGIHENSPPKNMVLTAMRRLRSEGKVPTKAERIGTRPRDCRKEESGEELPAGGMPESAGSHKEGRMRVGQEQNF